MMNTIVKAIIKEASIYERDRRTLIVNSIMSRMVYKGTLTEGERQAGMKMFRELNTFTISEKSIERG